jgi:hypothetical protein
MARTVQNVLDIMRLAIGRRNENDPDSNDAKLLSYFNDFLTLTMSDDVKLFDNFGTMSFTIDQTVTDGVYSLVGLDINARDFVNISSEIMISLTAPVDSSVSWNVLNLYQDPGEFYGYWGINNTSILSIGFPTDVLYYDNELVFRTIPDTSYTVNIYGYKQNIDIVDSTLNIPFDYWLRYLAYGAALNYAKDFRYDTESRSMIKDSFNSERKLLMARTHNQIKINRSKPSW